MEKWRISEFSRCTGVSIRTLHHYDRIGVLKASERQPNGFRLYSEKDYQTLEQILALKFLGFKLSIIKDILNGSIPATEIFKLQKDNLMEKLKDNKKAYKILEDIESVVGKIPIKQILKIIIAYHTLHQLEKKNLSSALHTTVVKKDYKLTSMLQEVPSCSLDSFLILINKILDDISCLAKR